MQIHAIITVLLALLLTGCGGDMASRDPSDAPPSLYIKFSSHIQPAPRARILQHLSTLSNTKQLALNSDLNQLPPNAKAIIIGDTGDWAQFSHAPLPASSDPEAMAIRTLSLSDNRTLYFAQGNAGGDTNLNPDATRISDLYAAYALLEQLGFHFLHPLEPTPPEQLHWPATLTQEEQPHWPIRAWHIHTQHPLELTHVLNGWGPDGPEDTDGWEALLPEWERFLEWSVANKQNRVEWFLLMADSWQTFADSPERQQRLRRLVDMAHQWGLAVGIDAPVVFRQQHAWTMIRAPGNELQQIRSAIDWLHQAGFDYIEIEMGFSEFTHPDDRQMLDWMNEVARYSWNQYGKRSYVKIHCTQDQTAEHFTDPRTGDPLNFNLLPYYADPLLGVMPHTVQYYDLEGPAYTYDNQNFRFMHDYLQLEAGRREVLYYPETAYWVSYDIDVPLFLPLYADRRLFDLRLIAQGEQDGHSIQGQVNFSSGWEWGYWLNDVITARAAWNPLLHIPDQSSAMQEALRPVVAPFGTAGVSISQILQSWIDQQQRLFLHGEVNGVRPEDPVQRNAQAYLQGWEAWDDVAKQLGMLETQPRKQDLWSRSKEVDYHQEIKPLLMTTATELNTLLHAMNALESAVPPTGKALFSELRDAMAMTVLRAEQVSNLYEYTHTQSHAALDQARAALDQAQVIALKREQHYRVDADRIASWEYNPTAYHFGYLWSVRTLHYWWRDEGKAVDRPRNPGYLNIMDPVDLANGEGQWIEAGVNLSRLRHWLSLLSSDQSWFNSLLFEPATEYQYPPVGLRDGPE